MLRTLHAEVSKGPQQDGVLHLGVKFCNFFKILCMQWSGVIWYFLSWYAIHNLEDIFASIPIYSSAEFWGKFSLRLLSLGEKCQQDFSQYYFWGNRKSPITIKWTLEQVITSRTISNKVEEQFAEGLSIKAFRYPKWEFFKSQLAKYDMYQMNSFRM